MTDLRLVVAFAIAIVLPFPDGSSKGCVALNVPILDPVVTEIAIPMTGILDESKYDNPLEELILRGVAVARSILARTGDQLTQFKDKVLSILAAIEASFVGPSTDNASGDTSKDRRQRWADHMTNRELSEVPNLLDSLAVISNVITHPVEFASNLTNIAGGLTVNGAEMAVQGSLQHLWKFTTTQVLPLLHKGLNQADQTNLLPPIIHDLIQNFNAIYGIGKLLGYVN